MIKLKLITIISVATLLLSCGGDTPVTESTTPEVKAEEPVVSDDPMKNKGLGPISNIELADIDQAIVAEGLKIFTEKCTACHNVGKRFVGPDLTGVTTRRTPEWIMNMILNPENMVANDPIAKGLLGEYIAPMANQNLTEEEARKVLEYFRTL
ncbi:MAG: cytochrome C [Flavobacteriales bacterium CG_4_10_14_0_2_um_filter_32_8]|nr:MAG: cytochrome C [Flavobacteriales bacterium CG_4_10_14_0_2_um_filter_32_8]PJB15465.1 MAG: cytochrome C [Flavobacteriales bacterium CG_4_9_14_3_um_filter_32_8]